MLTNALVANLPYTLSHEGVCGASVVLSVALSSPAGLRPPFGRFTLFITNPQGAVPLHVEPRLVWTDAAGASNTVKLALGLLSNAITSYGGAASALQPRTLAILPSGLSLGLPLEGVVGSALQVAIMAASNPPSATVVSGMMALWQR